MTRSKRSLKSSIRLALLSCTLSCLLLLSGCRPPEVEHTYREKDIPSAIQKICKEEYGLDVAVTRSDKTLWIYIPLSKILHSEFGNDPDKIFDETMQEKSRNVLTATSRVLLSADKTPECFVMVVSDIENGLDYTITANCLDIKKSYVGAIPWMEANRRFVIGLSTNPKAIGDRLGSHLKPYDISLVDFLAAQIAQRIRYRFQEDDLKKQFSLAGVSGKYSGDTFFISYSLKRPPAGKTKADPTEEMLRIAAYCLQTYDFKDFSFLEFADLDNARMRHYSREQVLAMKVR